MDVERLSLEIKLDLRNLKELKDKVKKQAEKLYEGRVPEEILEEVYGMRCPVCGAMASVKSEMLDKIE